MRWAVLLLAVVLALPAQAAFQDDGAGGFDLASLKARIERGDPAGAERALRQALAESPGDADVLNLLGYANRKLERFVVARDFYHRALAVDPAHRGALEYMGELEIQSGNPDAARALLARLSQACPDGCEELDDLHEAFAEAGLSP